MKLTTKEILALTNALVGLHGYFRDITENGKPTSILIPYNLSAKARWNAAKNLSILKRLADAHTYVVNQYRREVQLFGKNQDKAADPKANKAALEAEVARVNEEILKISDAVSEVDGLLMIPAEGFNLTASPITPEILAELMPLIEGEPNFGTAPPAK